MHLACERVCCVGPYLLYMESNAMVRWVGELAITVLYTGFSVKSVIFVMTKKDYKNGCIFRWET